MIKIKSRIPSRVLTLFLVLAMLMSLVPGVSATSSQEAETLSAIPFTDVSENLWYYQNVVYVYENEVMIGTGNNKFEPETTVTRAQFVKAIANMAEVLGYDTTGYLASDAFEDVKAGMYYDQAMGWAKQNDILQGTSSTEAEPDEVVTREQMAAFLYRYVDFLGYVLKDTEEVDYSDKGSVSTWAADAVTALTKAGVFNGIYDKSTNTYLFKPQEESIRAQMAALLHRLLDGAMYPPSKVLVVNDGEDYAVSETETYDQVVLGENSTISADESKDYSGVTLTVDGVEMSILSGKTYTGTVVLTPVKNLGNVKEDWTGFRAAVYVDDNGINSDYSALAAVISGDVTDASAANVVMQSETDLSKWQESFNGILINKGTKQDTPQGVTLADYLSGGITFDYTISNPDISYTGPGGNDFLGLGASVMASGNSKVLLEGSLSDSDIEAAATSVKSNSDVDLTETYDTNINNAGQVRTTLVAEESSVVVVDGAYTKASDGEWIEGYVASVDTSIMKSVPWMLGLYGNVRANNLLDNATAIYNNSILEGENWGVLSTDESKNVQVEVNNSIVRGTGVSTYGAYAIGDANISFTDSYVFTPTYAVIAANGANTTEFKDTEIYSGRAGAMYHSGDGSTITFTNSKVQVVRELALMRGSASTAFNVVVDNSDISFTGTEDNILVQLMENDDILDFSTMNTTVNYTDPAFAYGNKDNSLATATDYYNNLEAAKDGKTSTATFKDTDVAGDIYNSSVESGADLAVTLSGATLEGVVSSSVGIHDKETLISVWDANGQTGSTDYKLLGKLTNYAFASVGNDIALSLTNGSTWKVTGEGYLTSLSIDSSSDIVLPEGYVITVDSTEMTIDEIKTVRTVEGDIVIGEPAERAGDLLVTDVTYDAAIALPAVSKVIESVTLQASGNDAEITVKNLYSGVTTTEAVTTSGTTFTTPDGLLTTLTVDGVQYDFSDFKDTAILSGSEAVISYTEDVYNLTNMGPGEGSGVYENFRMALYINNSGAIYTPASVLDAVTYTETETGLEDVEIKSEGDNFNGILLEDAGTEENPYTINNANISLIGSGGDDFRGWGSGIMITSSSDGASYVDITNSYITAAGAIRTGIWAGGSGTTEVNVSDTVVIGYNADESSEDFEALMVPMMKGVPWALGLEGNNRVTGVLGTAQATYTNSIVVAEGWGALSTDSGRSGVQALTASNVLSGIGTLEEYDTANADSYTATKEINGIQYGFTVGQLGSASGYASYVDAGVSNVYEDSYFYAPDYTVIIAGGSATLNNVEAETERIGFMWHQNQGNSLTLNGGSYTVDDTMFMVKSQSNTGKASYTDVIVNDADITIDGTNAQSGVLLQLMPSDDAGGIIIDYYDIPAEGVDTEDVEESITALTASFTDVDVKGDVYNAMQDVEQPLDVSFSGSSIEGVISSSYINHVDASGNIISEGTRINASDNNNTGYLYAGRVVNTASPTVDNPVNLTLTNGTTWTITGTSYLTSLTIEDAAIAAADGYKVTLTVDGVEQSIVSGKTYSGNVVLSVTKELTEVNSDWFAFRAAVYVDDNGINSDYSALAAVISGDITDTSAANVVMQSETDLSKWQESFNGILINKGTKQDTPQGVTLADYLSGGITFDYTISNPDISYTGPGGNDFLGLGAAVMASGNSKVLLEGSLKDSDIAAAAASVKADSDVDLTGTYATNINNSGQVRTTLVAEESSVVVVDGAYTKASDGEWIDGYVSSVDTSIMKSVPWMLGLYGNVRANNLLDNSTAIYNNSILEGENWGVVSTDESKNVQVEVNNSIVRGTGVSTYGAYAIGNANISFTDSYVFTPTYAAIAANGGNTTTFTNTEIYSDRAGVMYHSGSGSTITFSDSQIQVVRELALMRAANNTTFNLVVDNSDVSFTGTEDNILVQLMDSDDKGPSTTTNYTDPAYAYGSDNSLETATAYYNSLSEVSLEKTSTATFKDVTVAGDIYNSAVAGGFDLAVTLDGAALEGVVSSSVGIHDKETLVSSWNSEGLTDSEDYKLLGKLTNYAFLTKGNDVSLSLTNGSVWTVTGTSYLTSLTIEDGSSIAALGGGTLTMTVDGEVTAIAAGTYTGTIVISIA